LLDGGFRHLRLTEDEKDRILDAILGLDGAA
jgi:hypothetical protein